MAKQTQRPSPNQSIQQLLEQAGPQAKHVSNAFLNQQMGAGAIDPRLLSQLQDSFGSLAPSSQSSGQNEVSTAKAESTSASGSSAPSGGQVKTNETAAEGPASAGGESTGMDRSKVGADKSGFPWISSIYTPRHTVHFDDTIDIWVDAIGNTGDSLKWEYEWSEGHDERVKFGVDTTHIHVELPISETTAQPGDEIDFYVQVENPSGGVDDHQLTFVIEGDDMVVWEVLFDSESVDSNDGTPTRIDPLIFDLNLDGQLDITGANQEGDGKIDGETVLFDMDPTKQGTTGWEWSSPGHRPAYYHGGPNSRAPGVPNGRAVYDSGQVESTNKAGSGRWYEDESKGNSAKIYDEENNLVGEWKKDTWGRSHQGRIGQYYWGRTGNGDHRERTEWIKGTGDGFLVWDHNNNGIIDDNTEMMSEFDIEGNKTFETGFEKLAHYFDKDGDGVIKGDELEGLKFWVDDGDAKTEEGELKELSEYGIVQIVIPTKGEMTSNAVTGRAEKG